MPAQVLGTGVLPRTLRAGALADLPYALAVMGGEPTLLDYQVWLTPDEPGRPPAYSSAAVDLEPGRLCEVLRPTSTATFSVARLEAGQSLSVPPAPRRHVYVGAGALLRSSLAEPLAQGDAFEIAGEDDASLAVEVTAAVPTELLVWHFARPA